jgi:carboxylate-amine ligase
MREGVHGKLIDFGKNAEVPFGKLCEELISFVDPVLDELGCRKEAEYATTIAREGSSADRQVRTWEKSGHDFHAVVDQLVEETRDGVDLSVPDEETTGEMARAVQGA